MKGMTRLLSGRGSDVALTKVESHASFLPGILPLQQTWKLADPTMKAAGHSKCGNVF